MAYALRRSRIPAWRPSVKYDYCTYGARESLPGRPSVKRRADARPSRETVPCRYDNSSLSSVSTSWARIAFRPIAPVH